MKKIAEIKTDFPDKFGLPRQSGITSLIGKIVFEKEYRVPEALRGLEDFSHLWIIWGFSESVGWSPTVRPPRLGGNKRVGVFATRSPFRPNPIALSCVKIEKIENCEITVSGIDMKDGSPIYDIKPYIPLTDCRPEAKEGYTAETKKHILTVLMPEDISSLIPEEKIASLKEALALDPRPGYEKDPGKIYGLTFSGFTVKFRVDGDILSVIEAERLTE